MYTCNGQAFFGLAGWLVSLPLTGVLVQRLVQGVSGTIRTLIVRVHVDRLTADPWEIALGLAVTLTVSIPAAWQPAAEAMKVAPKEALALTSRAPGGSGSRLPWIGLPCIALVLPLSALPGVSGVPLPGYLAILLLFVGFALLSPLGLRAAGRLAAPWSRKISQPAHLAARYIQESGAQTAVSLGALITAAALFAALAISFPLILLAALTAALPALRTARGMVSIH
ncbi:MAG: hypothetical protein GY859_38675 [Desulfobacterales bacterium]|nr:hypothetical protein [Desulfobacterales bacterium]